MTILGSQPIPLHRATPGTYDASGRWVPGAESTVMIEATVVPASGRRLEVLPEGLRTDHIVNVLTHERLRGGDGDETPDQIEWEGMRFEVIDIKLYTQILPHTDALAKRVGP